jgi:hypothetical protein
MVAHHTGGGTRSEVSIRVGTLLFKLFCLAIPCIVTPPSEAQRPIVSFWTHAVHGNVKFMARMLKSSALTEHPMLRSDQSVRPRLPAAVPPPQSLEVSGSSHGRSIRLTDMWCVCGIVRSKKDISVGAQCRAVYPSPPQLRLSTYRNGTTRQYTYLARITRRPECTVLLSCSHMSIPSPFTSS